MSKYFPSGGSTYTLQSSISSTQTTITLSSFTVPVSGTAITMAIMNTDIAYMTIAPRTSQAEFVSFTGITQNADGTATLTGVTRGLDKNYPYTSVAGFKLPHAGSTQAILSDAPQVFNQYSVIANDETITGRKQFPTAGTASSAVVGVTYAEPTADNEIATKKYVDDTAIAGSPKATNVVYGISKLSVAAVSATDPIVVGDNDGRVPTQSENDALAGTSGTPSSSNKYVTNADTATSAVVGAVARRNTTGDVTVNSTPTASTDAASKNYVDSLVAIYKSGTTTKNAADASATQTIAHGLGKSPKYVRISCTLWSASFPASGASINATAFANTTYNGTTQNSQSFYSNDATPGAAPIQDTTFTLNISNGAGKTVGVVTFDSTNISIAWTKTNSPTGTYNILWEAIA